MSKRRKGISGKRGHRRQGWKRRLAGKAIALVVLLFFLWVTWYFVTEPADRERQVSLVRNRWTETLAHWLGNDRLSSGSAAQIQHAVLGSEYVFAGIPRNVAHPHPVVVLENEGFVVGYCEDEKNPVWVGYRVNHVEKVVAPPRPSRFTLDSRVPFSARPEDYNGSGYDRGHMAPNFAIASRYGRSAQLQTFFMSNIAPQKPKLNRHTWRLLEERIANEYSRRYGTVWVMTGPIFEQLTKRLPTGVAVPVAFYKVIIAVDKGTPKAVAMIIPQDVDGAEPYEQFLTSICEIEGRTGFDFFHELEDDFETVWEVGVAERLW